MRKILIALALLIAALVVAPVSAQAGTDTPSAEQIARASASTNWAVKSGLPAKVGTQSCTYNSPTLHGANVGDLLWSGSQGELVFLDHYIQEITSPNCGTSVRAATNWDCKKNGSPANCGAELGHFVRDSFGNDWAITVYNCTPGNSCFGSSGADGIHTTYSAWVHMAQNNVVRAQIHVHSITVQGYTSGANHIATSGWHTV